MSPLVRRVWVSLSPRQLPEFSCSRRVRLQRGLPPGLCDVRRSDVSGVLSTGINV
jgi:hypothetical protein